MTNAELAASIMDKLSRFPASKEVEITFTRHELFTIVKLLAARAEAPQAEQWRDSKEDK